MPSSHLAELDDTELEAAPRISTLPFNGFDDQAALLHDWAPKPRPRLDLSRLPPEAFEGQVAQVVAKLGVEMPTEADPSQDSPPSSSYVALSDSHIDFSDPSAVEPEMGTLHFPLSLGGLILLVRDKAANNDEMLAMLDSFSTSLYERFKRSNQLSDLTATVTIAELAVGATPDGDDKTPTRLGNLGAYLSSRFDRLGELNDLHRAIETLQRAVALTPDDHADKPGWLNNLGLALGNRFGRLGELADLDCAIEIQQQAVALTPDGHAEKANQFAGLGISLASRFGRLGQLTDLELAIEIQERVVALTPEGHADMAGRLNNLSASLASRFGRLGQLTDLDRAIEIKQRAVALTPDGHADMAALLIGLGNSFESRFGCLGELADLDRAIKSKQQAVMLTPGDHTHMANRLNSLGNSLQSRFGRLGEVADLDRAIESQQRAITLTPDGHPDKANKLNSLGTSLESRFRHLGELSDLHRAIENLQRAVALTPDNHADKAGMLNNMGNALQSRFDRLGELADLDCAIESQQLAVALTPDGHMAKARILNNLGTVLESRFGHLGELIDLDRAIENMQRAVALTPDLRDEKAGMLSNLGASLESRFRRLGGLIDLDCAIESQQRAVHLTPDGHANKANMLNNLGTSLQSRFDHLGKHSDLDQAVSILSECAQTSSSSTLSRVRGARLCARLCARHRQSLPPYAAVEAYAVLIGLVPRVTSLGRTILQRYNDMSLANIGGAINDAVAEAIQCGKLELAVEWLEQGRSIIWAQVLQLRTPLDNLRQAYPAEADKLESLSRALDSAATSNVGGAHAGPMADMDLSLEAAAQKHRRLGEKYEELLEHIRSFNGFDSFLRPKPFAELRKAASSGPVVVINFQEERCDALILRPASPTPTHISLFSDHSPRDKAPQNDHADSESLRAVDILRHCFQSEHDGQDVSGPEGDVHSMGMLEALWDLIAEPVLGHLGFLNPPPSGNLPRVTWCVTGAATYIPIHAAGRYQGVSGPRLTDLVVSSYTPTLTALLNSKDHRTDFPVEDIQVLGVSQPNTPGLSPLPNTTVEINIVQQLHDGRLDFHWLNNEDATVNRVLDGMRECNWIHLACHGTQNGTESAFHLADGKLTLQHIMKNSLPHAELAVLSACQTAMGDKKLPEESLHLAAGMLMVGYDSVVATMWSIVDSDGPIVAKEFYKYLMNEGGGDSTKSAYALHHALKKLRQEIGERNFSRWVPFIHLGI